MRTYDRPSFRHLNDSERYRDYEYLADDAWIGPNERVPYGATRHDAPPWSTVGGWEADAFAAEPAFEDRGQGRGYGRDLGLGYGREHDPGRTFERTGADDYDRGYGRPFDAADRLEYPHEPFFVDERTQHLRPEGREGMAAMLRGARDQVRRPGRFVRRVVKGIFHGKGPKNWIRSDERIREEVCELLADHEEVDASEIEVTVRGGEVTLSGTAPDRRTKRLAEEILDDVIGVADVHNRLAIRRSETAATRR